MSIEAFRPNPNNDASLTQGEPISVPRLNIVTITPLRVDLETKCDMSIRSRRNAKQITVNPGIVIRESPEKVAKILGVAYTERDLVQEAAYRQLAAIRKSLNNIATPQEEIKITSLFERLGDSRRVSEAINEVRIWHSKLFLEGKQAIEGTLVFEPAMA